MNGMYTTSVSSSHPQNDRNTKRKITLHLNSFHPQLQKSWFAGMSAIHLHPSEKTKSMSHCGPPHRQSCKQPKERRLGLSQLIHRISLMDEKMKFLKAENRLETPTSIQTKSLKSAYKIVRIMLSLKQFNHWTNPEYRPYPLRRKLFLNPPHFTYLFLKKKKKETSWQVELNAHGSSPAFTALQLQ